MKYRKFLGYGDEVYILQEGKFFWGKIEKFHYDGRLIATHATVFNGTISYTVETSKLISSSGSIAKHRLKKIYEQK